VPSTRHYAIQPANLAWICAVRVPLNRRHVTICKEGDVHEQNYDPTTAGTYAGTTSSGSTATTGSTSTASGTAQQAKESAKQTASEVAGTAKEQGQRVASEVGHQARSVVSDVRQSVTGQVRTGHSKLADAVRSFSDEIGGMAGESSSPANRVVQQLGHSGRRAADYLESRGPEGLLDDVQDFARRKPGTFLLAMAAAGFVVGRLGKSTTKAVRSDNDSVGSHSYTTGGTPAGVYSGGYDTTGTYATGTTYDTGAGYGTGTTYATTPEATTLNDPYAGQAYDPVTTDPTAVGTAQVDPTVATGYDEAGYPVDPVSTSDRGLSR
jgi:hypothetical protein